MQMSDGEKLILVMLSGIQKALKIKTDIDPDFVLTTIHDDHLWGFRHRYSGIPFSKQDTAPKIEETMNILDMWSFIEMSYEKLSATDKKKLERDAHPFGKGVKFEGFDGNREADYISIAKYTVEQLNMFRGFKGRGFNSHVPSLDRYRRMNRTFEPMRNGLAMGGLLGVDQLVQLLKPTQ